MNATRRRILAIAVGITALSGASIPFLLPRSFHYLSGDPTAFVARFAAPPAASSADTRRELDELLGLQRARTPAQVEAARADRKKDVSRFFGALGIDAAHSPPLTHVHELLNRTEDDIGPYVKAVKEKYRRLRPYEIEPALKPCIGDVQGDLSYPSGHATYGYVVAELLALMVPERESQLHARADEFAHQRMMCGVHFRSDLEAGEKAARLLVALFAQAPAFQQDLRAAEDELRAALKLAPRPAPTPASS